MSRLADLAVVIGLVVVVAGISHFVITNPLGPSRLLYSVQAQLIQWSTRCSPDAPEWMAEAQRYATRHMAAPASQLAYISQDNQLHHCETGWKDGIFGDQPLQPDTRFRYASTTKTVTAAAILDLVNSGRLSLSDPIVRVLELDGQLNDPRVADITIAHLLSHRGGWDRVRTQDVMFLRNHKPWCPDSPGKLIHSGLMNDPGETVHYSNLGYCLLGLAIEKVSGQSYREFVSDLYGFTDKTLAFVNGPYMDDEVRYDFRFENFYTESYYRTFDFQALSSAAGLSGNSMDLAKLVRHAIKMEPLSILDGDMASDCDPGETQSCFGYGVYRFQPGPDVMPLYIHGGKLPGNPAAIIVDPQGGVMVWLGAGGPRPGVSSTRDFYNYIRETLVEHYALRP